MMTLLLLAAQTLPADSPLAPLLADAKALVVAFSAADCPVSKLYRPKLDRLEKELKPRGVRVFIVSADDAAMTKLLDVRRSTEVFLIDERRAIRYRGALDDQYGLDYKKDAPTKTWLLDAVEAVLAGKAPAVASTEAPGCPIEKAAAAAPAGKVSYHKDVAPILQKRCVECHRPGEIGPFSLLTFADAKKSAKRVKEAVAAKRMPPWHAAPGAGTWANDRSLTDAERAAIVNWVDGGTPEGNPKDGPAPRPFTEGWSIGTPDVVYRLPKPEKVPAEGTVPYRYVRVPTQLKEDRWVAAMEVRPSARKVVHHVLVFLQYPLNRLREQPPLDGGLEHGYFGIMVPGESPTVFPEKTGKKIPAGAWLIFQIHYTAVGEAMEDQTSIGIIWAKAPAEREVVTRGIVNQRIVIPAGAADHKEEAVFSFDQNARILGFLPHMHVRGKAFRYTAIHPDGREEVLLDIPRYDFNWQTCYRPKDLHVKAGTKIRATARFDNSKGNPANPDPGKEVRFGPQTWEEMLIGYIDFIAER
jgi:mono/diheme cytochrome c family protein